MDLDGAPRPIPCTPVIWESDGAPVVSGRELTGAHKLVGEIRDGPRLPHGGDAAPPEATFAPSEYGAPLMRGAAEALPP